MQLRVLELCKARGLSQKELSSMIGLTPGGLSKAINGNPTKSTLVVIAKALGVSVGDLFSDSVSHVSGFVKIGGTIHELRSVGDLEEATDKAQRLAEGTDTTE